MVIHVLQTCFDHLGRPRLIHVLRVKNVLQMYQGVVIRAHLIHATDMYQSVSASRGTSACDTCITTAKRCIIRYQDLEV